MTKNMDMKFGRHLQLIPAVSANKWQSYYSFLPCLVVIVRIFNDKLRLSRELASRRPSSRIFSQIALTAMSMKQGKPNFLCRSVGIRARYCRRIVPVQVLEMKLLEISARRMLRMFARPGGCPLRTRNETRPRSSASLLTYTHTFTHINTHKHTHVHTPIPTHIHTHTDTYTFTHTFTDAFTHTFTHIHTQSHTHTYSRARTHAVAWNKWTVVIMEICGYYYQCYIDK